MILRIWGRLLLSLTKGAALALVSLVSPLSALAAPADSLPDCRRTAFQNYQLESPESYAHWAQSQRSLRKRCAKDWTILVYMAADNELMPYALWDVTEMEAGFRSGTWAAGSTPKTDLIVQLDTAGNRGLRRLHIHQSTTPSPENLTLADFQGRSEEDIASPLAEPILPENSVEPEAQRLKKFLTWGLEEFPARHVMVILWGHGQGWTAKKANPPRGVRVLTPETLHAELGNTAPLTTPSIRPGAMDLDDSAFSGRNFGGLAFNSSRGTYLDIPTLKRVLDSVTRESRAGKPFDLYASDACLMQSLEVAHELGRAARFVVGSTQVQSFLGLPYRRLLYEINTGRFAGERSESNGSRDEAWLTARMLPRLMEASLKPGGSQSRLSPDGIKRVTMGSLSSSELEYLLIPSLNSLGTALSAYGESIPTRHLELQALAAQAPRFQGSTQDIGAFLTLVDSLLRRDPEGSSDRPAERLQRAVREARDALARASIAFALGTEYQVAREGFYLLGFRAVSIWIPGSVEDRRARWEDFQRSQLYRAAPAWAEFTRSLF